MKRKKGCPSQPRISRRGEKVIHTCKANEETGNVEHVGREARLVMIHGVLLARLVSHDVD
jgi:hypothetical protein